MAPSLSPEACAGAVCANCLQQDKQGHTLQLKCCSKCHRAWYCSKECQAAHWSTGHKQACKEGAPFVQALTDAIISAPLPQSYDEAHKPINAAHLAVKANPLLSVDTDRMVSNTVTCSVCFKTRDQLPAEQRKAFRCCPDCLWGWCCSEQHWNQHKPVHEQHCKTYAAASGTSLARIKHGKQYPGMGPISFCPQGKVVRQVQQAQQVQAAAAAAAAGQQHWPLHWREYYSARLPPIAVMPWLCMTEGLSIPLTAALAASHFYSKQQLAGLKEFTLHLVGSSHFELEHVIHTPTIEELMHLLPSVKKLHVVMIGPDLLRIISSPTAASGLMDKGTCPPCEAMGCSRTYSFYRGTYEAYAASSAWTSPTLALACNSGIGEEELPGLGDWGPALAVLMDKRIPTCFTAMQQEEAAHDAVKLQGAGAHIVKGSCRNPFTSLAPYIDVGAGPDKFYYMNTFYICIQGREEQIAAVAAASS